MQYEQLSFIIFYQLPALTLGLMVKQLKVWPQIRFFLLLPGTLVHELLHWIVALLLNGHPAAISIWPRRAEDGNWVLGSVGVANFRWYNGCFISLAPLLGIAGILFLTPNIGAWHFSHADLYQWLLTAPLWVMCWPSSADLRAGLASISELLFGLILLAFIAILWLYRDFLL